MAYITYGERKVMAAMQMRRGPNVVGPFGLLQPIADGVKLLFKETIIPSAANRALFLIAPIITFTVALAAWAVIPFGQKAVLANINVGLLYLLAISSMGVYGVIVTVQSAGDSQMKRPRSRRFEKKHMPCPSCHSTLISEPRRPRNTNRWPPCGSRLSVS